MARMIHTLAVPIRLAATAQTSRATMALGIPIPTANLLAATVASRLTPTTRTSQVAMVPVPPIRMEVAPSQEIMVPAPLILTAVVSSRLAATDQTSHATTVLGIPIPTVLVTRIPTANLLAATVANHPIRTIRTNQVATVPAPPIRTVPSRLVATVANRLTPTTRTSQGTMVQATPIHTVVVPSRLVATVASRLIHIVSHRNTRFFVTFILTCFRIFERHGYKIGWIR